MTPSRLLQTCDSLQLLFFCRQLFSVQSLAGHSQSKTLQQSVVTCSMDMMESRLSVQSPPPFPTCHIVRRPIYAESSSVLILPSQVFPCPCLQEMHSILLYDPVWVLQVLRNPRLQPMLW